LNTNISVTVPKNEQNTFMTEQPQKTNFIKIEYDFSFCDFITFLSYDNNKAMPAFVNN
jgi:hypothetical protein